MTSSYLHYFSLMVDFSRNLLEVPLKGRRVSVHKMDPTFTQCRDHKELGRRVRLGPLDYLKKLLVHSSLLLR